MRDTFKVIAHALGQLAACSPGQLREMAKVWRAVTGCVMAVGLLLGFVVVLGVVLRFAVFLG